MGLTVHYELRLPAALTDDQVTSYLQRLRTEALTLSFKEVSPVVRVRDRAANGRTSGGASGDDRWRAAIRFFANVIAEPYKDDADQLVGEVDSAQGFLVNPGDECDTAMFAFMRGVSRSGRRRGWFWNAFCKTQYASMVSDEHFVTCHVSLITLLDRAIRLGIDVMVVDESEYFERRDERHLVSEVHRWNHLMARFAGHLSDTLGPKHSVEAAIFQHPRFEHLEMGEG